MPDDPKLFISYAQKDKRWLDEFLIHLRPLVRQKKIAQWTDREILAGSVWQEEIAKALSEANIAVLLVTPAFLASEFIQESELPEALKMQVIWVAVEPSLYIHTPLAKLQCANKPVQPLAGLGRNARNTVWVEICEVILQAAAKLPATSTENTPPQSHDLLQSPLSSTPQHIDAPAVPEPPLQPAHDNVTVMEAMASLIRENPTPAEAGPKIARLPTPENTTPESRSYSRPDPSTNPIDDARMIYIPAGTFQMGNADQKNNPPHTVTLDGYWIYEELVTVKQYRKFCKETNHAMPPEPSWGWKEDHPIVNVSWNDAKAYCAWAKVALPTEAQWEKAARGPEGFKYPWGNDWNGNKCANSVRPNDLNSTVPVGKYDANGYGLYDMAGNVWEWCGDWYNADYCKSSPAKNPTGPANGDWRVLRGGSWNNNDPGNFRCACRGGVDPEVRDYLRGFRCCASGL
ncbi:MAG TPA: SUMF1/EgtB/PvdO family nonheme iron enzyme [Chthonomonadaceae bacterium]|nr:SUMF1/EgtB/PvdO family nonheme iron enzyme [Chthonomonadaceae bacterium]